MRRIPALAALLLLLPASASAQSYAETVWTQLQMGYSTVADGGDFSLVNYVIGKLSDSDSDYWTFPLEAGTEYFILAACDEDCSDVDLFVRFDGDLVASDVETDDVPVLRFTASYTGDHTIEIEMFECSAEPCFWGMGVFEN